MLNTISENIILILVVNNRIVMKHLGTDVLLKIMRIVTDEESESELLTHLLPLSSLALVRKELQQV